MNKNQRTNKNERRRARYQYARSMGLLPLAARSAATSIAGLLRALPDADIPIELVQRRKSEGPWLIGPRTRLAAQRAHLYQQLRELGASPQQASEGANGPMAFAAIKRELSGPFKKS
jgi:hypothetical protein